ILCLGPLHSHHPLSAFLHPLSLHDTLPISLFEIVTCFLRESLNFDTSEGTLMTELLCQPRDPTCIRVTRQTQFMIQMSDTQRERSEEHTSELQSRRDLVCRLLIEKKT